MPNASLLRLSPRTTCILLVDFQTKLVPTMPAERLARAQANCDLLLRSAAILSMPVVATEQYPQGLGATVPALRALLPAGVEPLPKLDFGCAQVPAVRDALAARGVRQVILAGMEAHVCIALSALGFVEEGFEAWVAEDACVSRSDDLRASGLRLCAAAGVGLAAAETLLFALLQRAGTAEFKAFSQLLRARPPS